ncbi:MAG: hypothetical protein M3R38_11515 [Actinomycetota bacterium]|nr:hypothetical protein [Actinomycetota bacterium]
MSSVGRARSTDGSKGHAHQGAFGQFLAGALGGLLGYGVPGGLGNVEDGLLTPMEKRAGQALAFVLAGPGRFLGWRLSILLLGAERCSRGVYNFPVAARTVPARRAGSPPGHSPRGYKVLSLVLLRSRRGPARTERLAWRVEARPGPSGPEGPSEQDYPDLERALLAYYG